MGYSSIPSSLIKYLSVSRAAQEGFLKIGVRMLFNFFRTYESYHGTPHFEIKIKTNW